MTPTIVTGHGRSGTHWLTYVLEHFMDARHEPQDYEAGGDVIIDCRLRRRIPQLLGEGYNLLHLVRDGREVARSTHTFYAGTVPWDTCCREWAEAVLACQDLPMVKLEDLLAPQSQTKEYLLPHHSEWDAEHEDTFWQIAGGMMDLCGYER